MKLLIVESPNKKKTISKYLGNGWQVEASMGHVCDLPQKEMGVAPPDYKPKYELSERGAKTVSHLIRAAQNAESIWLAMDPDREGEAIAAHLAKYLKKTVGIFHRVVFNEITEKAVKTAVANPRRLNRALFDAQQARRVIDRLVGYQVSPRLCHITKQKLSAGRVQSVAVRLLVERERAIRAFNPTAHFGVRLYFEIEGIKWFADWDTKDFVNEDNPYVLDKELVDAIAKITEVFVLSVDKKLVKRKAPPPFITTTLQKAASIQLGLDAEETMRLAQLLFEKGLITYHRTDNPNLSKDAILDIEAELRKLGLDEHIAIPPNRWKSKAGAQEAHEAIRPSNPAFLNSVLEPKAQRLYELIRVRALSCQMLAATVETTKIVLVPLDESHDVRGTTPRFVAKWIRPIYPGWRLLAAEDYAEEKKESEGEQETLPQLKIKDPLKVDHSETRDLKTQAPKRYTEPALIGKLEKEGIGRPSTYAAILSNIKNRGYVQLKGKCFEAMNSAETIVDTLVGKFQFMEVAYTREMELALDEIAAEKQEYLTVVAMADQELQLGLRRLQQKDFR